MLIYFRCFYTLTPYLYLFIYLFKFYVHIRPYGYDRRSVTILAIVRSPKHKPTRRTTKQASNKARKYKHQARQ